MKCSGLSVYITSRIRNYQGSHDIPVIVCIFHQIGDFLVEAFRSDAVVYYRELRITKARGASVWPKGEIFSDFCQPVSGDNLDYSSNFGPY